MKEVKMSKQIVCILIILSFLSVGCNYQSARINKYSTVIKTWNGHHIDGLIDKWGYPQQSYTASNGNKVYVYSEEATYITPIWTTPNNNFRVYGGKTSTLYCTTYFETDNNKTIVKGSYKGNACETIK
jgi:hypothetical protein